MTVKTHVVDMHHAINACIWNDWEETTIITNVNHIYHFLPPRDNIQHYELLTQGSVKTDVSKFAKLSYQDNTLDKTLTYLQLQVKNLSHFVFFFKSILGGWIYPRTIQLGDIIQ